MEVADYNFTTSAPLVYTSGATKGGWKMATNYSTATAVEPRALTALFNNSEDANSAYGWLLKNGYNSNDIHLLMSEETRQKYHLRIERPGRGGS